MAQSQCSIPSGLPATKPPTTRRVWTRPEEEALIHALKELVVNGWRADNGFRPGYLVQLELSIAAKFPRSGLTANRHINSKLTVWKKTYGQVSGICNTSGFGFNSQLNMVEVPSDDVWANYVRVHPDVAGFRNKCFPYYDDWIIIFGKDRATGEAAQQIEDAILDLEHPHAVYDEVYDKHTVNGAKENTSKTKAVDSNCEKGKCTVNLESDDDSEGKSMMGDNDLCNVNKGKEHVGAVSRKRKTPCTINLPQDFVNMMGTFINCSSKSFDGLASKIGTGQQPLRPPSPPNKTRQVIDLVGKLTDLTPDFRVRISHKIVSNPQNTELFLNMDEECQISFVHLLMQGLLD